ncbi:MAG TPA: hypothetical protein VGO59_14780 [Verrucomicrobiae bacterium]|jgi:hypothetical protein
MKRIRTLSGQGLAKALGLCFLLILGASCYAQGTLTIYNMSACPIVPSFTRSGLCPMSENINWNGPLIPAGSSATMTWPVGFNNAYLGMFSGSGNLFVYQGANNPTYSVEFIPGGCAANYSAEMGVNGVNAISCYIYNVSGGCGGSLPAPPPPPQFTNSGCVTLHNNTSNPQYYQFQATGGSGTQNFSGCSGGISVNGDQGSSADGDGNEWLAVYPGETLRVCCTINDGTNNAPRTLCALQAPGGLLPCSIGGLQLQGAGPRCVDLCNDGLEISGNGAPTVCDSMAQSSTPNNTTGNVSTPPITGATPPPSGTNGIIWPAGPTNGGLMLDITGRTGFAALNQDLIGVGTIVANGVYGLEQQNALNASGIEQAIHSNAANVVISNLVVSNLFGSNGLGNVGVTNLPTNFPDAAAIGLLGVIASNTARTNGFDTNLEASATAIASNTAAPLTYTNLNTEAYSTNPASVVAYASNTLAGPANQSLLGYSQSASTAAEAVTVGGSPGSLLTISFDLPVVGSYSIDCNPMDNADVADFAGWLRGAMQWLVGLGFVGLVMRDGMKATQSALQAPQGQFPKLMVLGNSIGWPLAAVYVVALVAAMVAVPFAVVTWFSVGQTGQMWWQQVAINPFSGDGVGRSVALALWLADQFMPMSYIVSSALYYIGFRFALSGVVTVAATIVRALMA